VIFRSYVNVYQRLIHATKQELAKAEEHIWVNSEKNNDSTISGHNDPILSILFPA
jgi:hypothetical protein